MRRKVRKWIGYDGDLFDPWVIFGGPTYKQAKNIFWRPLLRLVPSWAVETINKSELTIKLINGVELCVVGWDSPERNEGRSISDGVTDEIGNCSATMWEENLRPALADHKGYHDFIGVPEGRNHYYDMYLAALADDTGEWGVHTWTSDLVLPPAEIESMRRSMDPLTFEQEVRAQFISFVGRAYYTFDASKHVRPCTYNENEDLVLCFDFNVSPGVCVACQERNGIIHVIGEIWIQRYSNTMLVCDRIRNKWAGHKGKVFCYGDATGGAQGSAKVLGSDWAIVAKELSCFGGRLHFRIPESNPLERQRVNTVNSWLHQDRIIIDGTKAPRTVLDFDGVQVVENSMGELDKSHDPQLTHITDAIGYMIHRFSKGETKKRVLA